jgi:hypothetical protein
MATRKIVNKHINESSSTYVGVDGELFYDTESNTLKISDGSTAGGITLNTDGSATPPNFSDTVSVTVTSEDSGSPQSITWSSDAMHVVLLITVQRSGTGSYAYGRLITAGSFDGQLLTAYHEATNNGHSISLTNAAATSIFNVTPTVNKGVTCVYINGQWRTML